ncbi:MAG: histidine kinase [Saprospiraceae bacterium]
MWNFQLLGFSQNASIFIPYTRLTVADGLAQMQVRTVFVDHDGYVWIGTQGGISGYDGSSIRSYKNSGAVSESSIVSLAMGRNNIYGTTLTDIFSFDGISARKIQHQKKFHKARILFEDCKQTVWILSANGAFILRKDSLTTTEAVYPKLATLKIVNAWGDPSWQKCYFLDTNNKFYGFNPESGEMHVDSTTFSRFDNLSYTSNRSAFKSNIIIYKIGSGVEDIYRLSDDSLQHVASKSRTVGEMKQLTGFAPLCYMDWKEGISTLFILRDSIYRPDLLPTFNHIRFAVEHGKKAYVGTDEGFVVVHLDGLETLSFDQCDYPWSIVPVKKNEILVGCYKSGVYRLRDDGKILKHYNFPKILTGKDPDAQILSNFFVHENNVCFGSLKGFYQLAEKREVLHHFHHPYPVEAFAFDKEKQAFVVASDRVYWIDSTLTQKVDSINISEKILSGVWANDLLITTENKVWVGAANGIQQTDRLTNMTKLYLEVDQNLPCNGAVTLVEDAAGTLWAGGTCGLMIYRPNEDRFHQILPEIINNRVNQLAVLRDEQLICASNNDLYLLDISSPMPKIIAVFNETNGLNLNEPSENGMSVSNDRYIWLPSVTGIQRLDFKAVTDNFGSATLRLMSVNNSPVHIQGDSNEIIEVIGNSALLDISVIDHSGRNWKYQHSLDNGEFTPWQSSHEILVAGLQHGLNNVRLRASWNTSDPQSFIKTDGVLKAHLSFLSRTGSQRLLLGISFLLTALIVAVIIKAQRNVQRVNKLKSDLHRNRLRTIQAYLNPHFLFNTLTSIQDHILHQNTKDGNDMIIRLSRVFRKVLDVGKYEDDKVPLTRLSEEISLIHDIVYLNNKQLTNTVAFELEIDQKIQEADPFIPPMLIQPFVENAFKHAFNENDLHKAVVVRIVPTQEFLAISIKDNGIGYDSSITSPEKLSMGIELARERMSILNALNIENSIDVREIKPHGTAVEIKIKKMI